MKRYDEIDHSYKLTASLFAFLTGTTTGTGSPPGIL